MPLTKEQVVFFLESVREQAVPLESQKYMLIDMFINSVTVYDDEPGYLTIKTAYNLTNLPGKTYRIPTSKDGTVFGFDGECTTIRHKSEHNSHFTIAVFGTVFVQTRRHALP